MQHLRAFCLLALLTLCLPASAQDFIKKTLATPSLVVDTTAIVPGKAFTAGVKLVMAPGWHTYWQFGGDAGAPTKIQWSLPPGFTAGPVQWPIPKARMEEGDLLTYVYEDEVLLLVEIRAPENLVPGEITLKADISWLACKETCIPGSGPISLTLPSQSATTPANAELFAHWKTRLPKADAAPFPVQWTLGEKEIRIQVSGIAHDNKLEFFPLPPSADFQLGHPKISATTADGTRTISFSVEGTGAAQAAWAGVLVTEKPGSPSAGWSIASTPAPPALSPAAPQTTPPAAAPIPPPAGPGLLSILWGAFLGGIILNLMPCVLPVIALKIFGFVQQAGQAPERVFRLGLAFVAGVFAFFLTMAALIVAFHAAGNELTWGAQFQNPYLLSGLIALVFVFALSMFGVFEITINSQAATALDGLGRKDGYGGAFAQGMFTTLLGTSCTAPLLGPVLGFAFVEKRAAIVFLIFGLLAAGMSLPYFLLTWKPAWMRFLPKPGAWMERMKQFIGFALTGVALWLLSILGHSRGIDGAIALCIYLLILALAAWIYGCTRNALGLLLALLLGTGGWWFLIHGKLDTKPTSTAHLENVQGGIPWQPFSPERLADAVHRGQPVFIDFTADWCLNCKYNEKFVLETEPVRAAFRAHNILALKADWTEQDPVIRAVLNSFGRAGVPAYVLYMADGSTKPVVLPEILTTTILLHALSQIKP